MKSQQPAMCIVLCGCIGGKVYALNIRHWTSLVAQWLKESTCQCRGHGFEPWSGKTPHATEQLSPRATTTEARAPRACAPQQEKPLQ